MNVIIAGAGEVGTYTADVLAGLGHNITVIDSRADRLAFVEDTMDVRTLLGNAANADILREAGAAHEHAALVAATSSDEVNLLTAAVGRGLGAGKAVARVHHSAYFQQRGLDYRRIFGITRLICPEYFTAQAIAATLRNPAALAVEAFAAGQIEVQEFPVAPGAEAIGQSLLDLPLPEGMRLAAITRDNAAFLPAASTTIQAGDGVILVGNADVFEKGRRLFQRKSERRQRLVIMGGSPLAVWLCRAMRDRAYSIRLFETDRARAEELAAKLDWITVLQADPTETSVFEEERVAEADAFIGLSDEDEHNILGASWAKSSGVGLVIASVHRRRHMNLIRGIGIDHVFSPRMTAVKQIERSINDATLLQMASLAEGVIDAYSVRVKPGAAAIGRPLRDLGLRDWMIAAVQHADHTRVPTANYVIQPGDNLVAIGRHGQEKKLRKLFAG